MTAKEQARPPENTVFSFGTGLAQVWHTQKGEEMNNETLEEMQSDLLEALGNDELLNKKGLKAISSLIKSDESRAVIRHTIKSSGGDNQQYAEGLKVLIAQYNSSTAFSTRSLCENAATDKVSRRFLEERVIPLLVELGIIIKAGEKSYHWQAWDKIGCKPGLMDVCKSWFETTPEKQALRKQQAQAADEARMLQLARKQSALAHQRKTALLNAANAQSEAHRIESTLPPEPENMGDWAKTKAMPLAIIGLLAVVVVGGMLSGENTPGNTPPTLAVDVSTTPANPDNNPSTLPQPMLVMTATMQNPENTK